MIETDDDFVFKEATTSPKSPESKSTISASDHISNSSKSSITITTPTDNNNNNNHIISFRFSFLDTFIAEKRREIDSELNKLAKERFDEFVKREKEQQETTIEQEKEEENIVSKPVVKDEKFYEELDKKEQEMFEAMRVKAQKTWKELREEHQKSLEHLRTEQSARLSQESQLQESLQASGSVFDRDLFEKVVEKCGKGRGTAFGKEKMTRFWEVLDKSHPKGTTTSPNKIEEDKVLASLLGL